MTLLQNNYRTDINIVDGINLSVSNGETSSTITLTSGTTQIASQTIEFTGDIVFKDNLTDGTTEISGSNITTGTISADRISLYGLTIPKLDAWGNQTYDEFGNQINALSIDAYGNVDIKHITAFDNVAERAVSLVPEMFDKVSNIINKTKMEKA